MASSQDGSRAPGRGATRRVIAVDGTTIRITTTTRPAGRWRGSTIDDDRDAFIDADTGAIHLPDPASLRSRRR